MFLMSLGSVSSEMSGLNSLAPVLFSTACIISCLRSLSRPIPDQYPVVKLEG